MKRAAVRVALALLAVGAAAAFLAGRPRPAHDDGFAAWRAAHAPGVDAYLAFLARRGVADVLPAEQLLRRGRRWRACGGQAFELPPRAQWDRLVPTLELLRELRGDVLPAGWQAVSVYRSADFNRCEGGSARSRHLDNAGIDLEGVPPVAVARLCAAWRQRGPGKAWGLGFYSDRRIHLDTAGFRTWGYGYHADSSPCTRRRAAASPDRLESGRLPSPRPIPSNPELP